MEDDPNNDSSGYVDNTGDVNNDSNNYADYVNNDSSGYYENYTPIQYDPEDQSDAETERLLRQNSDAAGNELIDASKNNPSLWTYLTNAAQKYGSDGLNFAKKMLFTDGKIDYAKLATGVAAISAFTGGDEPKSSGYRGSIPNFSAVQQQINYDDPNRRPGSAGRQYFTDTQFVDPSKVAEAQAAATAQAQGILAGYKPAPEPTANPYEGKFKMAFENMPAQNSGNVTRPASGVASVLPVPEDFAEGGMAKGRYLRGSTDGMADKIPSSIDGKQKAALSHGEFVVPADVVSHLGNGNSDAGAKKLYEMMARVRKARTGNPNQGKQINPNKFMPGGQVGYAAGGIAKFAGPDGSVVPSTGVTTPPAPAVGSSVAEGLSAYAGPYVSNMLAKGQALSNQPYQAYQGPLTAGASDLQKQQYAGLSDTAKTGYTPTQYQGGIFDTTAAQQYMNPYLSAALDPQLQELRRQGQITNLGNQAQATKMGAFGSSGSALMQTEGQRNVLDKMQQALGQGYSTAYDKAMAQYNADQERQMGVQKDTEASRQFSAKYALDTLDKLGTAGANQRAIEAEGIAADKAQFEEARDNPYKQVQFQRSLLTGLPITTTDTTQMQGDIAKLSGKIAGLKVLYDQLSKLGVT